MEEEKEEISIMKFKNIITKSGLIGVAKHIKMELPNKSTEKRFKEMGVNVDWFCGYVIIPKDHPYYGKGYDDFDVDVHGGLTYSSSVEDFNKELKMDGWVFGFDCNHYKDKPEIQNCEYTISEIKKLAEQLSDAAAKDPMDIAKEEYEYDCENAEWQADAYIDAVWSM